MVKESVTSRYASIKEVYLHLFGYSETYLSDDNDPHPPGDGDPLSIGEGYPHPSVEDDSHISSKGNLFFLEVLNLRVTRVKVVPEGCLWAKLNILE